MAFIIARLYAWCVNVCLCLNLCLCLCLCATLPVASYGACLYNTAVLFLSSSSAYYKLKLLIRRGSLCAMFGPAVRSEDLVDTIQQQSVTASRAQPLHPSYLQTQPHQQHLHQSQGQSHRLSRGQVWFVCVFVCVCEQMRMKHHENVMYISQDLITSQPASDLSKMSLHTGRACCVCAKQFLRLP